MVYLLKTFVVPLCLLVLAETPLLGTIIPNGVFGDHMVLQRDVPIPVWGRAEPGEQVSVMLENDMVRAVTDNNGFWKCQLPCRSASTSSLSITIRGDRTPAPIILSNILIGDVWLCSGQSNMTLYLKYLTNFPGVTDDMVKADFPLIRQGAVARQPSIDPVESRPVTWTACTPQKVGMYSAPGFYFARQLQKQTGVPIGIILSSFGSTALEEWISKEALTTDSLSKKRMEQQHDRYFEVLAEEQSVRTWHGAMRVKIRSWIFKESYIPPTQILNKTATAHYNGMIRPLAPFPIKGVIWYQGEEEALEKRASDHRRQLPLLIADWRALWGQPGMPFIIQQLPEFKGEAAEKTEWAELREAQADVVEKTPGTILVCGYGAGEVDGLHPANKREIGNRWASTVLSKIYGVNLPVSGPVFDSMETQGKTVRIHFRNSKGLATTDGQHPRGFFTAGKDRIYFPAQARIEGETVVLSSDKVSSPVAVRYAFQNAPSGLNLTNDSGLPAFPFRADPIP
jgi:sialate O-acetylesterase